MGKCENSYTSRAFQTDFELIKRILTGIFQICAVVAADFAASLRGDWIHLNSTQMYQLTEACRYHSMGRLSKDVTIQTCWDADRLDLGRVGERPNPTYLGNKAARDKEFIKAALHRSKNRFANYLFTE